MNTMRDPKANTWTIAYRNPRANHFKRVTDWSGTWAEAEKMAGKVKAANPDLEIWYTGTLESELAGYVTREDCGNILVPNRRGRGSRRVPVRETGSVAALGVDVPADVDYASDRQVEQWISRHMSWECGTGHGDDAGTEEFMACDYVKSGALRTPIGPRSEIFTMLPYAPDGTTARSWSRVIGGTEYRFSMFTAPGRDIWYMVDTANTLDRTRHIVVDVPADDNRPISAHPAYDAIAAETGTDPVPGWTALGDTDVFQFEREPVATIIPPDTRRFGVVVEWDDTDERGAQWAVIGSFATWAEARDERDRLEESGRWDYVRGVIPLCATESDV